MRCTPGIETWAGSPDDESTTLSCKKPCLDKPLYPVQPSVRTVAPWAHVTDKWLEIRAGGIWNMTHSNSPKSLRLFDLDSYHYDWLAGSAPALPSSLDSTHQGLVNLNRSRQSFTFATYHRYAKSLEHRPRRPVVGTQRPLQGFSRKAVLGGRQMPGGFKPSRKRCPRLFQDCRSRHGSLVATRRTDQTAPRLAPRHSNCLTSGAAESLLPSQLLQVDCTRLVARELLHELTVRVWEIISCRQVVLHARSMPCLSCKKLYHRRS
jgi:hypothetical protein